MVDAGRVAIGVLAEDGTGFADFVHHGVDEETARWFEPIGVHGGPQESVRSPSTTRP
jgi:hypothetical protein